MLRQIAVHLGDDLGVMGPAGIQPENCRGTGCPGPPHGKFDPILHRGVLGLAAPEDVPFIHPLLQQGRAGGGIDNADRAVSWRNEGLVVGTVFLGFLGHQADVGDTAHGGGIKGAMLFAVFNHLLIDGGIAAVRHHGDGVVQLVVRPPHAAAVPDNDRHGGVDDNVVGNMEVGDALAGIHHGQFAAGLVDCGDVRLDFRSFFGGKLLDFGIEVAQAVVDVDPQFRQHGRMSGKDILVKDGNAMAEHDRIRHLHHGRLEMERQQEALVLRRLDLPGIELPQGRGAHDRGVNDFAGQQRKFFLEHHDFPIRADKFDADIAGALHGEGFLAAVEIAAGHMGDAGF